MFCFIASSWHFPTEAKELHFCVNTDHFLHKVEQLLLMDSTHKRTQHYTGVLSSQPMTGQCSNILRFLWNRIKSSFFFSKSFSSRGYPNIPCSPQVNHMFQPYPENIWAFFFFFPEFSFLSLLYLLPNLV